MAEFSRSEHSFLDYVSKEDTSSATRFRLQCCTCFERTIQHIRCLYRMLGNNESPRTEETAHQLRAFAVLAEDLSSVPSFHARQLTVGTSSSGGSDALFLPLL